jgi:hypothetical protein
VAQLGARLDGIEEVVGSNPIGSTKQLPHVLFRLHPSEPILFPVLACDLPQYLIIDAPFVSQFLGRAPLGSQQQQVPVRSVYSARLVVLLGGNPCRDASFQHVEGKCAAVQDFIMKCTDIVLFSEFGLRKPAQLEDF